MDDARAVEEDEMTAMADDGAEDAIRLVSHLLIPCISVDRSWNDVVL